MRRTYNYDKLSREIDETVMLVKEQHPRLGQYELAHSRAGIAVMRSLLTEYAQVAVTNRQNPNIGYTRMAIIETTITEMADSIKKEMAFNVFFG